MKLFMQKPLIQKFDHAKEFAEAYQIGEGDFIRRADIFTKHILRRSI